MSLLACRHAQPTWSGLPERSRMKRCIRLTSVLRHPKEEAMVLSSTCKKGKGGGPALPCPYADQMLSWRRGYRRACHIEKAIRSRKFKLVHNK